MQASSILTTNLFLVFLFLIRMYVEVYRATYPIE